MTQHDPSAQPTTLRRREFLKGAGLAAAGAVAAGYGASSRLAGASDRGRGRVLAAPAAAGRPNFRIEIDGATSEALARVDSVHIEDLAIDVREMTTGLDVEYRVYGPGDAHYGKITLRSRVGQGSQELQEWWRDCARGANIRKSISVICLKRDGSELRRYNLFECFPVRYTPGEFEGSSTGAFESLVLKIGALELAAVGTPPKPPAGGFEVTIAMPAIAAAPGAAAAPGLASEADRHWERSEGGALVLEFPDDGEACSFHTTTPGHKYIDTLTLRGPLTAGRKALCAWINETVTGKPWKRSLAIKEIAKDGSAGKTFTYHDCFPTRYVFPALSADGGSELLEEVRIKPVRCELK